MITSLPGSSRFESSDPVQDTDGSFEGAAADENHVYAPSSQGHQDLCGTDSKPPTAPPSPIGWPMDLGGGGTPDSSRVRITDLTSFLGPVRYFNTNVVTNPGDIRWDLRPGEGLFGYDININDMTGQFLRTPAMPGGVCAFNGPACPW